MDNLILSGHAYPPITPRDEAWGVYVLTAGRNTVPAGTAEMGLEYPWQELPEGWYDRPAGGGRRLRDFELVYIAAGAGRYWDRDRRDAPVAAGDLFFLPPGTWHHYTPRQETGWSEYWIVFAGRHAAHLHHLGLFGRKTCLHPGPEPNLEKRFQAVLALCQDRPAGFQASAGAQVLGILAALFGSPTHPGPAPHPTGDAVQKAIRLLDSAIDRPVQMQTLAREVHLSYNYFRRIFKEATGVSPHQYHLQVRLNAAKALLNHTGESVGAIAAQTGFADLHYFCRLFRRKTGLTPSEWRSRVGSRTGNPSTPR